MEDTALVITLAMVVAMALPAMAAPPTADSKGTITVNSPIMGAQYSAYQIFKLSMNDDTDPSAFAYSIDKDDPFYAAVNAYAKVQDNGLTLTGIPSTVITPAPTDPDAPKFEEYAVSVDLDKFDAQKFGQAMHAAVAAMDPAPTEYKPTYETGKNVVTPAKADAITFENLPYGYYLITNNYDDTTSPLNVSLMNGDDVIHEFTSADYTFTRDTEGNVTDVTVKGLETPDTTTDPAQTKSYAVQFAEAKYPDLNAAKAAYEADHNGDNTVKTWEAMTDDEKADILARYQATAAANAVELVKNQILAHASDDNATDGTVKERLVFIDSTTPNGVINEKNEYEKWDVPVNPEGYADLPDFPDHDEPNGGKNIVIGETTDGKTVYADSSEAAIGDKIHYQLSINAVNFERTDANDPKSVKQVKEYVIADYQNKNMKYVPKDGDKYGLTVKIVKKDADGNNETVVDGPMDYSSWVEDKHYFFTNVDNTDLAANGEVFAQGTGGIVIPWVEKLEPEEGEDNDDFLARVAATKNVYKNSVYAKANGDTGITAEAYAELTSAQKATYFLGEDGKYYSKVPVYAEVSTTPVAGRKYTQMYGDGTEYNWIQEGNKYYLVDENNNKVQAIDKTGEKVWECDTVYFASKYDNDVTILVDYWMELLDTAVIDGTGNKNFSQFGVDYVEPFDTDYEFGTEENPGDNPPDEPQQPEEKKDKDDATVFTYAIALKKIDPEGNELVGAKFKLRGVTVTEKSKGYYKVKTYSHATTAAFGDELETDNHGVLVVEGLPTKWDVEIMETEAPAGFNKLTDTITLKPFKTGEEVTTTATVTYKDIEGVETSITTTTVEYKNASGTIAKKVTVGDADPKYYGSGTTEIDADTFNGLIANYAAANVDETEVTNNNDKIATIEVVNNAGAELPSTGGIGTTIFYVVGAILVIGAGVVLITRRRMDA